MPARHCIDARKTLLYPECYCAMLAIVKTHPHTHRHKELERCHCAMEELDESRQSQTFRPGTRLQGIGPKKQKEVQFSRKQTSKENEQTRKEQCGILHREMEEQSGIGQFSVGLA
ncbi:hypothetical protein STEG23_002169 [Scotinomys teguina]